MSANHVVEYKSKTGFTTYKESIFFEPVRPNTHASYVLLKKYYFENDETNMKLLSNRMRMVAFSRNFLSKKLADDGVLICTYCKKSHLQIQFDNVQIPNSIKATIDHIIPISDGCDPFDESNINVACGKCNSKKGSMSVDEFTKKFGYTL